MTCFLYSFVPASKIFVPLAYDLLVSAFQFFILHCPRVMCLQCKRFFQVGAASPMATGQVTENVPCLSVATKILKSSEW